MPRKKQPPATAVMEAPAQVAATAPDVPDRKWAEPYRPIFADPAAKFEMGENKLTSQMVFFFGKDPGIQVKERLKHYGYFYHADQKAWTVNATPVTREIAKKLTEEFAAGQVRGR